MITVREAAKRVGKDPATIRRWIRSGRLRARKIGTQHVIEEADLESILEPPGTLPLPTSWRQTATDGPMPDWVALLRAQRASH